MLVTIRMLLYSSLIAFMLALIIMLLFSSLIGVFCWHELSSPVDVEMHFLLAQLILLTLLLVIMGEAVDSLLHYMLPAKRLAVEEEDMGKEVKKPRPDQISGDKSNPDVVMAKDNGNPPDVYIDEDLHSRQLAVYGRETMRQLLSSNVLVSGLGGLGAEVAKNLILAGVKSVKLHDERTVEMWDLSSNFLFTEDDIGKNRALASVGKLQELNTSVAVSTWTTKISKEKLSQFQAVVFTGLSLEKAIDFDDYCRMQKPPIAFIKSDVHGLFGSVFCDFGPEFTVYDVNGEEPRTGIVASISNDNPAIVSCVEDERLEFQDGDLVVFTEVKGMTELNDGKPRRIKNVRSYGFVLEEDTTNFGAYEKGGIVTEVKQSKMLHFKPLKEALKDPGEFLLSDTSKFDRPPLLHLAFHALDKFVCEFGHFPAPSSKEDATKLVSLARSINEISGDQKLNTIDEHVLRHFSSGCHAVLNPMAAVFGGIVAQEVVKACSGKFHPIFQFFYFDSLESLPKHPLRPEDIMPLNCRYDAQISVFGTNLQKILEESNVFVVGAGALGCEFLKNLALMGASCRSPGKLTITDDDVIEKSNLSRQFLFRDWNIGQAKSTVAASAATKINPSFQIEALQSRASSDTENIFDDNFWENQGVVISALDNVNARLYIDSKCVYFQKPLLESGTLGTKCHTQVVFPHLTENYGASRDPPEKEFPMCTVHSYPHNIYHCLTWARSEFEGMLEKAPTDANAFLSNPQEYKRSMKSGGQAQAQAQSILDRLLECLVFERCITFEDCVAWSRRKFEEYFTNRVKQLVFTFPENTMTTQNTPFWSAPKRFPKPLQFTSNDPAHLSFIAAASILRAKNYGIPVQDWAFNREKLSEVVDKVQVPDFQPKITKNMTDANSRNGNVAAVDDNACIDNMIKMLEEGVKSLPLGFRMNPIHFEKDDDMHIELISGLANMRARNYSIPEVDKLKAKFIAGRIVPAIATTTAMAAGLVCLELYKVLFCHSIEKYRNSFANLALPLFSMAEPAPAKVIKHRDLSWTLWDRWVIEGNLTLQELLDWFQAKGLTAYSISCMQTILYNKIFPKHRERLNVKLADLVQDVAKLVIPPSRHHFDLVVSCEDDARNDVDVPLVSIYYR